MVWYLDTSAFLKLLVDEPESSALRSWLAEHTAWSSYLLRTEALRAAGRLGIERGAVEHALEAVALVLPAASTFRTAGMLEPRQLRSLDALHLAAALELGDDLEGVVTYDARLASGAAFASIAAVSPGGKEA